MNIAKTTKLLPARRADQTDWLNNMISYSLWLHELNDMCQMVLTCPISDLPELDLIDAYLAGIKPLEFWGEVIQPWIDSFHEFLNS